MNYVKKFLKHVSDIAFPVTCVCCGFAAVQDDKFICEWCENERFEPSHVEKGVFLPEIVWAQYSLWNFDKGGYLQQMLHDLKYNYLRGVGEELGYLLGKKFKMTYSDEIVHQMGNLNPIIIPVPLHRAKRRKRGFNQARAISVGISRATSWEVISPDTVIRIKKTKTQTGLNLEQRSANLKNAFKIENNKLIKGTAPVIVDDVFTTGATTFELAKSLAEAGAGRSVILTIGKA